MKNNLKKISIGLAETQGSEMFEKKNPITEEESWQKALSRAVTNPKQLLQALQLDSSLLDEAAIEAYQQDYKNVLAQTRDREDD